MRGQLIETRCAIRDPHVRDELVVFLHHYCLGDIAVLHQGSLDLLKFQSIAAGLDLPISPADVLNHTVAVDRDKISASVEEIRRFNESMCIELWGIQVAALRHETADQ